MAKGKLKIKDLISEILTEFLDENGYELWNVEFVKEAKDWFLRVYLDKCQDAQGENQYIGVDDCEKVSRFLSEKLDETDPIEQNYYLEVSSAGLDRVLSEEKHFLKFQGSQVEVSLYKALNGNKKFSGILLGIENNNMIIEESNKDKIALPMEDVAKTNLAVVF